MFNRIDTVESNPLLLDELGSFFNRLRLKHFTAVKRMRTATHWTVSDFAIFTDFRIAVLAVFLRTFGSQRSKLERTSLIVCIRPFGIRRLCFG